MEKLKKRHVATIEFYVYGDTPKEVFKESDSICNELNHNYDCQAVTTELHEQPFATLSSKKIDISKLKINKQI